MYMHMCAPFSYLRFRRLGSVVGTVRQVIPHSDDDGRSLWAGQDLVQKVGAEGVDGCKEVIGVHDDRDGLVGGLGEEEAKRGLLVAAIGGHDRLLSREDAGWEGLVLERLAKACPVALTPRAIWARLSWHSRRRSRQASCCSSAMSSHPGRR